MIAAHVSIVTGMARLRSIPGTPVGPELPLAAIRGLRRASTTANYGSRKCNAIPFRPPRPSTGPCDLAAARRSRAGPAAVVHWRPDTAGGLGGTGGQSHSPRQPGGTIDAAVRSALATFRIADATLRGADSRLGRRAVVPRLAGRPGAAATRIDAHFR